MPRDLQEQFEDSLERYVERLFAYAERPEVVIAACLREQRDPVPYIVKLAEWISAAEEARAWFERHGPAHLQPLPFCEEENLCAAATSTSIF